MQVSCGYKHTLLLNQKGSVYSFGEGLFGQLGVGRVTNQNTTEQIKFPDFIHESGKNEKIKRIQASGYNSAAFNEMSELWMWGDRKCGKFGCSDNFEP